MFGAAGVAYLRGRSEVTELVTDALVHGIAVGTVLNVVGWVMLPNGDIVATAKANTAAGLGKLGAEGVKVLSGIDVDKLYSNMKDSGLKVGPIPKNPSVIVQDAT